MSQLMVEVFIHLDALFYVCGRAYYRQSLGRTPDANAGNGRIRELVD